MTDTWDWVPLDRALKQLILAEKVEWSPIQDLLSNLAVGRDRGRAVRRTLVAECEKYAREEKIPGIRDHLVDWSGVYMPPVGWRVYGHLYNDINLQSYRFLPHIQERYPGGPPGSTVHRIDPQWVAGTEPTPFCDDYDWYASLTKHPSAVTCVECKALLVEEVLA